MGLRELLGYGLRKYKKYSKEVGVNVRMDQGVNRWFGHVDRMEEERLQEVCMSHM